MLGQADQWIADLRPAVFALLLGKQADSGLHHHATLGLGSMPEFYRPTRGSAEVFRGAHKPVYINEKQYDYEATAKLIELFRIYGNVVHILFNDIRIPFVKKAQNHDNHFHLKVWS